MNKISKQHDDFIKGLGDEIVEKMPDHLRDNLHAIPMEVTQNNSVLLNRFTLILNIILSGWTLVSILIFKKSWVPLVIRFFDNLPLHSLTPTTWITHPLTILLGIAICGFGIWWIDVTDEHAGL